MEYTIKALADLAGVTPRTLRWYHQEGLLKPLRTTEAGYRLYGPREVDRLQDILFYRELGLELSAIRRILDDPAFDRQAALQSHLLALRQRRKQLDTLIGTVEQTLLKEKGEIDMSDKEKFEGFKRERAEENDRLYGAEARERYGSGPVEEARKNWMGLSREKFHRWQELDRELREGLAVSVQAGNDTSMPDCDDARQAGIAELYVADERFTAYYDGEISGCARFLRDAVKVHMGCRK